MTATQAKPLPAGWKWAKLGDVCEFSYGASLPSHSREAGDVPVYGSNGLVGHHTDALTKGPTIVIGRKGSIGEVHYSDTACWPIDTTYFIERTKIGVDLFWLTFLLRTLNLRKMNKAAAVPGLNREDAYGLTVPLPPIPEQKRIAAILTEQLAAVDQARAAAEAQLQAINQLPAAYLRDAFNGVTSPKTLDKSKILLLEKYFGVSSTTSWKWIKIGEFAETRSGTTPSRSNSEHYVGSIPWVKTGELKDGSILDTEEHISEIALRQTSLKLLPVGTLLIAMYGQGQTRGRTGLLQVPATTNQACFAILPKPDTFDTFYLQWWFRFSYDRLRHETEGRGGNQPNLNGDVLRGQQVPLPPASQQQHVCRVLSELFSYVDTASEKIKEQLDAINQLPATLLQQAFTGNV